MNKSTVKQTIVKQIHQTVSYCIAEAHLGLGALLYNSNEYPLDKDEVLAIVAPVGEEHSTVIA